MDQRAIVIEANEAAHFLLPGLKREHPLSFALRSPVVLDGIDEVLAAHEPLRVEYSEHVPSERTFEVHIGPLRSQALDSDARSGVVLFFRDLTSARRLEAMRTDFVANASHELRTPLASLLGFVETLQGPARNDAVARERFLDIMRQQAQRMTRLIDDLLSLSRIEMRLHVHPTTSVDLVAIARHMVETLAPLAKDRGSEIVADIPDRPVPVLGDRDELLRLLRKPHHQCDQIRGGRRHGRDLSRVDQNSGRPAVRDARACAITARELRPNICRASPSGSTGWMWNRAAQKGGTGLGLAIVKHIVNRHRGTLTIESEPGEGAPLS